MNNGNNILYFCSSKQWHRCAPDSSFPSCRPLFKDASGTLDKSARFSALYRQDSNKLSNDDMLKLLADFRKLVMLLWALCVTNCLRNLTDVLERKAWKICSYRLYFGSVNVLCVYIPFVSAHSSFLVNNSKDWTGVYFTFPRPEKMAKLPVILGNLDVTIDNVAPDLTSKTCRLAPCSRHER